MNPDEVADYLKQNPEFFAQHSNLLAEITLHSPHGGNAVSLGERQMGILRDQVRQLEGKLAELIRFGEDNDAIAGKVHQLAVDLIEANDLAAVLRSLYLNLGGRLNVPHVALRLWELGPGSGPEFEPVTEAVKEFARAMAHPYCGGSAGQDALSWFGEHAANIGSMAQIPLWSNGNCFGLLVLASEDAGRFYSEMGLLYLSRIGEMSAAALQRLTPAT